MSVKPHPKQPGFWIIRYYPEGRKIDPKTGKPSNKEERLPFRGTEEEAIAYHEELVSARKRKVAPQISIYPTFSECFAAFSGYYRNRVSPGTYDDFKCAWNQHIEPYFGEMRPSHLTPAIIEAYKTQRLTDKDMRYKDGNKPPKKRTINKELSYLSVMVSWLCLPEIAMCPPLPFAIKGFPRKQVKPPTPVVPSRCDIIRLLRAAERPYRSIFILCYYAGLRKNEAYKLKGENVNWGQGYMVIRGKGEKERVIPIHDKLRVYLRKARRKGYLFPNPSTGKPWVDLRRPLQRAVEKAGLSQHVYPHLLRHGFGTHSIQSGINLRSVQLLMGHYSSQVTEMYTTLANQFLGEEMQKFGRKRNAEKNGR